MRILLFALFVSCFVATSYALFNKCAVGKKVENLEDIVKVSGCKRTYCRLKKKYSTAIEYKFTADKDVKKPINSVTAEIAGIPFPFIGFDQTDACPSIYEPDGETKAQCPLKAGKEYVYKTHINVLEIYPAIKVIVRWALNGPDGQLMCFEVPARIVN